MSMSTALIRELEAMLEVLHDHGLKVGTPTAHALLVQIAYRAGDKPMTKGRERLAAREMFRTQVELGRVLGVTPKAVGKVCAKLEKAGIRVRKDGRTAAPYKAMIYRLPTVAEFARAFGLQGDQVAVFEEEVRTLAAQRSPKGVPNVAAVA